MNALLDIVDPGAIDVLRGPLGTLYGRNATGGVIRLNAAMPTHELEGRLAAEYCRFDHFQLDGKADPLNRGRRRWMTFQRRRHAFGGRCAAAANVHYAFLDRLNITRLANMEEHHV